MRGINMRLLLLTFGAAGLLAVPVLACPVCNTGTGRAVRAGILSSHFGSNLLATLVPFVFFLGIAYLIYYGLPGKAAPPPLGEQGADGRPSEAEQDGMEGKHDSHDPLRRNK